MMPAALDPSDPSPLLEADGIERLFSSGRGLPMTSFTLKSGERLGVTGENGAGKSTLLDVVSGITPPDRGTVWLEGRDMTRWPASRRARAGLRRSLQFPTPAPGLRVSDYVAGLLVEVDPATRRQCEAGLKALGIVRSRVVASLSGGERRILDVGVAILSGGSVVLLDEPFAGVDAGTSMKIESLVRQAPKGTGLLLVDHDPDRVHRLCDTTIVLGRRKATAS